MSKEYAKQQKQLIQHRKAIFSLDISIYFSHQQFCLIIRICAGFQNQRQCKISHDQPTYSAMFTDQLQQYINGNINPRSGARVRGWGSGSRERIIDVYSSQQLFPQLSKTQCCLATFLFCPVSPLIKHHFTQQQRLIKLNLLMNSGFL